MDDTGTIVDLVAVGMVGATMGLAVLVMAPQRWDRWTSVVGIALTAAGLFGAVGILSASAAIYADGSTHWTHTAHAPIAVGVFLAGVGVALLLVGRWRPSLLRWGLAIGFTASCLLLASVFAYQTPG